MGIDGGADAAEALYRAMLDWFRALGVEPDLAHATGPGHRGQARFGTVHARLMKSGFGGIGSFELNLEGPHTYYNPNHDWDLAARCFGLGGDDPVAELDAKSTRAQLAEDSMLIPALAMIRAARPGHGWGMTDASHRLVAELEQRLRAPDEGYDETVQRAQSWRRGLLPSLEAWNFLSAAQLSAAVAGQALREWIASDARRGRLSDAGQGLSLWAIPLHELEAVYMDLWNAGLVYDPRRHAHGEPRQDDPARRGDDLPVLSPSSLDKRRRLLERLRAQEGNGPDRVDPVASLKEFFDGNTDEGSLAPNAQATGRPPLAQCRRILEDVRARDDVQDVLVAIRRWPDLDEAADRTRWPRSDTVYVLASCELETLAPCVERLVPDELTREIVSWREGSPDRPPGAPALAPGMTIFRLWWD